MTLNLESYRTRLSLCARTLTYNSRGIRAKICELLFAPKVHSSATDKSKFIATDNYK